MSTDVTPSAAPTALRRTAEALDRYRDTGRAWLDGMWHADPLADAVAADRGATRATRALMTDGAAGLDDVPLPDSVQALLDHVSTDPSWLERERLDRSANVLVRYSAQWGLVLGAASLLAGADNWVAARPLLLTGRYGTQPAVRSIEVGEWLSRVVLPGGMAVDGPGWRHTVRVRLIHAHVRRHVVRGGEWDEAAWGVPVPQPYMAFTLAEFGHVSIAAMEHLGVVLRPDELADVYHLWRYVGHVIGVEAGLNPVDEADQVRIEELYRLTSPGPDQYSRDFCRALTEDYLAPQLATLLVGPERLRQDVARRAMYGMSRVFLGDEAADALGVPQGSAKHVVRALRPGLRALDVARLGLLGRERVTRSGYAHRERELTRLRAEHGMTHDLVDAVPGAVGG